MYLVDNELIPEEELMHRRNQPNFAPRLTVFGAAMYLALHAMSVNAAGVDVYAPSLGGTTMDYDSQMGGSSDGDTLVGTQKNTTTGITAAYRWTLLGGKQYLGSLNGGANSTANAANADASVIVGSANDGVSTDTSAYRWDSTNGMVRLANLNGGNYSIAKGVSADGQVIVGESADGAAAGAVSAVAWNAGAATVRALGNLNGGTTSSANAVSADGNVAVGSALDGLTGNTDAVRWIGTAGAQSLGHLSGGNNSVATAVSSDGAAIAGYSDSSSGSQAFLYRDVTGMQGLGYLSGGTFSKAFGVSANGAVVVGDADTGGATTGFRWTYEKGMQALIDWLHDNDATYTLLPGNSLDHAYGVSGDGNTVFGVGTLNGRAQPFVARTYGAIAQPVIPSAPPTTPTAPPSGGTSGGSSGTTGGTTGGDTGSTAGGTSSGGTTAAGGSGAGSHDAAQVGVIGLFDLGDSLHNASLYGQAMQSVVQGFLQGGMHCDTFDLRGICVSTGALYSHNAGEVSGSNWQGDFSIAYRFSPNWVAGFGYQGPSYKLEVGNDTVRSRADTFGAFVEYGNRLRQGVFARAAIAYQQGDATVNRSYLTGSGLDNSQGETAIGQRAVSTQVGYVFVVKNMAVMPYVGVDYLRTTIDGYTETTGQFPVRFNGRNEDNVYGTVGVNGHLNIAGKAIVSAGLKHVQRLNKNNDPVSGDVLGLGSFSINQDTTEHWNEVAVGVQFAGPAKASRVNIGYGHRFASGASVARDIASVSFTMGF